MTTLPSFPALLEAFFTQRLMQQRQASPHTVSSYRDTFRQFLKFVQQRLHKPPSHLNFDEIDASLVVTFLDSLEKQQGLSVRSRNLRLTAIHSFFRYAAFEAPAHSAQIQRVLAIPSKRFTRTLVQFLTRAEVDAPLAAPDQRTSTRSRPLGSVRRAPLPRAVYPSRGDQHSSAAPLCQRPRHVSMEGLRTRPFRTMTLSAMEFLRRFVQHILPRGFVRIRQSGFLANTCRRSPSPLARTRLAAAHAPVTPALTTTEAPTVGTWACPRCGATMILGPILSA